MRHYLTFATIGTSDQAQGHRVVTETEVCGSGVEMLAEMAIGMLISTGHGAIETWNKLLATGLTSEQLRISYEHLGLRA
jgi:hypothetical protein